MINSKTADSKPKKLPMTTKSKSGKKSTTKAKNKSHRKGSDDDDKTDGENHSIADGKDSKRATKNKKPKALSSKKVTTDDHQSSSSGIKDVYTFELSPGETITPSKHVINDKIHQSTSAKMFAKCDSSSVDHNLAMHPTQHQYHNHLPYDSQANTFGPNASLSSLSQLSQSIGGGAINQSGPILLNHQSYHHHHPQQHGQSP
ncbi:hypothetical protein BLA29_010424, partial [Euroglyphus maynei]